MKVFNTGVELSLPPFELYKLPPDPNPRALPPPPPTDEFQLKSPLSISPEFYNNALDVSVPVTFAIGYFVFVTIWNQINRHRQWKPWAVSRTRVFKDLTLIHNILLAIFSGLTFAGMCRCMWVSTPGWLSQKGVAAQVDALCKMQGPRGLGDAVSYDTGGLKWQAKNQAIHLGAGDFAPDPTDVGRIWNEGLAFWGWLFYLSKFYEVIDTIIVLSKGKRATTLQTFHHFGAMFCMWAGMRYMSAPIWMFVLINSFIHTIMYTFYSLATIGIRVNPRIKRVITTLQIFQFVIGVFYATIHLFVAYEIPVSTPVKAISILSSSAATSDVASDLWSSAVQAGRSSGSLPPWAKRLAYRAVGAEGLAESVQDGNIYTDRQAASRRTSPNQSSSPFESPADTNYRSSTHYETIRCIDTQGQTFAIWLNVIYLTPLMGLFIRFFVKSYITGPRRIGGRKNVDGKQSEDRRFSDSLSDAARQTSALVESLGTQAEEAVDDAAELTEDTVEATGEKITEVEDAAKDAWKDDPAGKLKEKASQAEDAVKDVMNGDTVEKIKEAGGDVTDTLREKSNQLKKMMKDSSLGDSYVEVIEKMRQGAMQASEGKTNGEEKKSTPSSPETSSSQVKEEPTAKSSSGSSQVKEEATAKSSPNTNSNKSNKASEIPTAKRSSSPVKKNAKSSKGDDKGAAKKNGTSDSKPKANAPSKNGSGDKPLDTSNPLQKPNSGDDDASHAQVVKQEDAQDSQLPKPSS